MMTQANRLLRIGNSSIARGTIILTHRPSAASVLPASYFSLSTNQYQHYYHSQGAAFQHKNSSIAASAIAACGALLGGSLLCHCEASASSSTPETPIEDKEDEDEEEFPTYTMAEVSKNTGKGPSKRIWMTYGGCVYDATDFIANHPGGSGKIIQAAGGPVEPHWRLYPQHFASDQPLKQMEKMIIGYLHPDDQEKLDDYMDHLAEAGDPYEHEPVRSSSLKVHSQPPMNAEVPRDILRKEYITPLDVFYIRCHHPVPFLSEKDVEDFRLDVDLSVLSPKAGNDNDGEDKQSQMITQLSLAQIKSLPKMEVITTLQCSGNRRSGFNDFRQTSGTPWDQGAISTAKWGGVRLVDVLILASEQLANDRKKAKQECSTTIISKSNDNDNGDLLHTLKNLQTLIDQNPKLQHLRFESLDGMKASIDILKALNPFGDVIIVYEMNGEPLPPDHGYPLRVIVPGYAAVRNVKWLSKLELAEEQAEGMWQRGLNYKVLPPSVTDAKDVDLDKMPGLGEVSIFSGITDVTLNLEEGNGGIIKKMVPGEKVMVKASGWAWAGGGRKIVRVDVTGDNGKSWTDANIGQGGSQPYGRAWAWVFWECSAIPAVVREDGMSVELSCKGVDMAFNTQPESSDGLWNVRGLANNSWYRLRHRFSLGGKYGDRP